MRDRKNLLEILSRACSVVDGAGDIIREHNRKPRRIRHKGRIDLVTETDLAVEEYIKEHLSSLLPEASFLAEEGCSEIALGDCVWVLDPVDGTTNFAHGVPVVAISLGLWHRDRVILGIVDTPLLGERFTAVLGGGAFCNGNPLHVSKTDALTEALVATGFPYTIEQDLAEVMRRLGAVLASCQGIRRMGAAAVDLAYGAAGRYDAFYEKGLRPWDMAAGTLLVEEAGGQLSRFDGSPMCLLERDVVASNSRLHAALLSLVE